MHASVLPMEPSPRSRQVAEQLKDLMKRHGLEVARELSERTAKIGKEISYVTINRILKAEAKFFSCV